MADYIGAVDQGTTSTKFIIFDRRGRIVGQAGKEHRQIYPRPGWVEHDPLEIWANTQEVIQRALAQAGLTGRDLAAIGVANQRETVVAWDKGTGRPFSPAIVWQCTRTRELCRELIREGGLDRFRARTGLPVATYFSGPKMRWLLDNVPELRPAVAKGRAVAKSRVLMGTMETWLIWWLTGGPDEGAHVTDVTNASRTMLMGLAELAWDGEILSILGLPEEILPKIVSSSDSRTWGLTRLEGPLQAQVPVCGALGDQQAALVGQACFKTGQAKNTYGTGCFLLLNTGPEPVPSKCGLITTPAYRLDDQPAVYCLEGSIAVAGALVQWLRDNLGLIYSAAEIEELAGQVPDNGGIYFVPAFSGLFAPRWRSDARGVIVGLTGFAHKSHLARAVLEATAYQTRDLVEAMNSDSGLPLTSLKVDGGMVGNELLMQFQADQLGVSIVRPAVSETTALGAACAAGLAVGFWSGLKELEENWRAERTWQPALGREERTKGYQGWLKAVERTLNWID